MLKQLLGFLVCLGGICVMGGCFYAAYKTDGDGYGWGIGGFIAGMSIVGAGTQIMTSK